MWYYNLKIEVAYAFIFDFELTIKSGAKIQKSNIGH